MTTSIAQWLERLGLEQYARPLLALGYDSLPSLRSLTDDVLIRAGVNLASHRRRILIAAVEAANSSSGDARAGGGRASSRQPDEGIYGNSVVAEMHEERRASQVSAGDLPPPPPCSGAVRRESFPIQGYLSMTKNRDSASSSNSNSPRASTNIMQDDTYDCLPPPKARFPNLAEETPPMLPPKKNSRKEKPGLPPSRSNSQIVKSPALKEHEVDPNKRPPIPKPRVSIQKPPKPVPAPRKKKNSIRIDGVTEDSSDVNAESSADVAETETESVYEYMCDVGISELSDVSLIDADVSLPATSSSIESLDVSDVVSINWGSGGDAREVDRGGFRDELDVGIPPPPLTPRVQVQEDEYVAAEGADDEYVAPDDIDEDDDVAPEEDNEGIAAGVAQSHTAPELGERPPSGGCDGQTHSPLPLSDNAKHLHSSQAAQPSDGDDENVMVDNDLYSPCPMYPQPEGRVVIGAELSAEEVENFANESAENVPGRLGAAWSAVQTDFGVRIPPPDDPCYGTVWDMKSEKRSVVADDDDDDDTRSVDREVSRISTSSSTDSFTLLGDAPPPPSFPAPNPPVARRAKPSSPRRPSLDSPISFQAASRDSTISFNEPPPSFAPPPLPPMPCVPSLVIREPPFLPPRPFQSKGSVIHKAPVLSPPLHKHQQQQQEFPPFSSNSPTPRPPPPPSPHFLHGDYLTTPIPRPPLPLPLLHQGDYITSPPPSSSSAASQELYSIVTSTHRHGPPPPKPLRVAPVAPVAPMAPVAPVARQESGFDGLDTPTFRTRPGFGEFPGSEEDSFGQLQSVGSTGGSPKGPPPVPPPKVNPFEHMYDKTRGTYCLQDELHDDDDGGRMQATSPTVWESDDTLSDGGDFFDDAMLKPDKNTLKSRKIPIVQARKSSISEKKGYMHKQSSKFSERTTTSIKHKLGYLSSFYLD